MDVIKKSTRDKIESKPVPKSFLQHILKLGFDEIDAPLLYKNKENWTSLELDAKIKCSVKGCKFVSDMFKDCLVEHCEKVHEWRDYPCKYKNCQWVAYSSGSYNSHITKFHESEQKTNDLLPCSFRDCRATFGDNWNLQHHERVHQNISFNCHFCTYKCSVQSTLTDHLNNHFDNRSFKCDFCDKKFLAVKHLNQHIESIHEAVQYKCPLCEYRGNMKGVGQHIRAVHKIKGSSFDRKRKKFVLPK